MLISISDYSNWSVLEFLNWPPVFFIVCQQEMVIKTKNLAPKTFFVMQRLRSSFPIHSSSKIEACGDLSFQPGGAAAGSIAELQSAGREAIIIPKSVGSVSFTWILKSIPCHKDL